MVYAKCKVHLVGVNVWVIASDDGLYARIHMRDVYLVARTLLCIPPRVAGVGWELSCDVTLALASSDVGRAPVSVCEMIPYLTQLLVLFQLLCSTIQN